VKLKPISAGGGFKRSAAGAVGDACPAPAAAAAASSAKTPISNNPFAGISFKAHVNPLTPIQSLMPASPQIDVGSPPKLCPDPSANSSSSSVSLGLSIHIPSPTAAVGESRFRSNSGEGGSSSGAGTGAGAAAAACGGGGSAPAPSPSTSTDSCRLPPFSKNFAGSGSSSSNINAAAAAAAGSSPMLLLSHPAPSPGKSPKQNPFSSASPKTNPFMSMGQPKDHFWGSEISGIRKEKELGGIASPAPAPAPAPAAVINPFFASSSGIALNVSGNVFGAFGSGLGGTSSIFQSNSSSNPFGNTKGGGFGGGGILSTLGGAPLTAMFGSTAAAEFKPTLTASAAAASSSSTSSNGSHAANLSTAHQADKETVVGGDEADADDVDGAADEDPEEDRTPAIFGKTYALLGGTIVTGEENEESVLQVRAKLYRLVTSKTKKEKAPDSDRDIDTSASASVTGDENVHVQSESNASKAAASTAPAAATPSKKTAEWVEVGVGPLRILRAKGSSTTGNSTATTTASSPDELDTRIVMRREEKKGGAGTKLLLNLRLTALCSINMSGEKAFSVSTLVSRSVAETGEEAAKGAAVETVSYMLKYKLAGEADKAYNLARKAVDARKQLESD